MRACRSLLSAMGERPPPGPSPAPGPAGDPAAPGPPAAALDVLLVTRCSSSWERRMRFSRSSSSL